jgi:hypothetical protein
MDAVNDAIDNGYVSGLSASNHNHWSATVWNFPGKVDRPYSELKSLPIAVAASSTDTNYYVFYMGKPAGSKKWEVFSALKWQDRHWEPVAVRLPAPDK